MIEVIKVCREGLSAPKLHIGNLKVVVDCHEERISIRSVGRPLLCGEESRHTCAKVVFGTTVVGQEVHRGVWRDVFGMSCDEFCRGEARHQIRVGDLREGGRQTFYGGPEGLDCRPVFIHGDVET